RETVANKFTGAAESPDERLLRSIEAKADIPESKKDEFRSRVMSALGALVHSGEVASAADAYPLLMKKIPELRTGIVRKLTEDAGLTSLDDLLNRVREQQVGRE